MTVRMDNVPIRTCSVGHTFIDGTTCPWCDLRKLRAEVVDLRAVAETKVHGIHVGSDGLYMGLSGGAAGVMAEMLAEQYKQGGGINYIEMRFESKESMPGQRFLVTVKRADGKTPHELRVEAEAERDRLRAEVAALQDQRREMHTDMADLATLVRRLALALRKAQLEHSTVSDAAMEFLRKRGLDGEVLRA